MNRLCTGDGSGPRGAAPVAAAIPAEPPFRGHPLFRDPEVTVIRWRQLMSIEDFIALQHTYSYVIRVSGEPQAQLDTELPTIVRAHFGDAPAVTVPVISRVWRTSCR